MKNYLMKAGLAVLAATGASSALAVLPAGVEGVFTGVATDFGTLVGYGWTLFLIIVGGLIMFKLTRRVVGKST